MKKTYLKVTILGLGLLIGFTSFVSAADREKIRIAPKFEREEQREPVVERKQLNRWDSRDENRFAADFTVEQVDGRPLVKVTNVSRFRGRVDIELVVNRSWNGVHNRVVYPNEVIQPGGSKLYKINDDPMPGLALTPMYSPYAFIVRIYSSSADHKLIKEYNPLTYFTVAY